jgi:hypothetical protein
MKKTCFVFPRSPGIRLLFFPLPHQNHLITVDDFPPTIFAVDHADEGRLVVYAVNWTIKF